MASKKSGKVLDLTTRVLIEIRDEVRRTNGRLDETNARLGQLSSRVDTLSARVETGFADVNLRLDRTNERLDRTNSRLDNLIDISGERYRDLDARIRVLEARAQ